MMQDSLELMAPRTTADVIFDQLKEEIVTLKLLPHAKISEAEIANRLGVSRQPVRDAFNRLANLDLISVRPQRATTVRGFSLKRIENARFVRLAVELEIVRNACSIWDDERAAALDESLDEQRAAIAAGEIDRFHQLDYRFHQLIAELGNHPLAFETVTRCKQQVDRLCKLSLERSDEATAILNDHEKIASALRDRSLNTAIEHTRHHLSRLDATISEIHAKHKDYFE